MIDLDDLKPKQIREEDFTASITLHDKPYQSVYKRVFLVVIKKEGKIRFQETLLDEYGHCCYELDLDTIRWLVDKKRIKSKRINLVLKLAENE